MATLEITDRAERIRVIFNLVDRAARQLKTGSDERSVDQLRTDAFFDRLTGRAQSQVRVELQVTVPASVLAGVTNAPGWLHGHGPITSAAVWELAEQSTFWRRVVTDPATGAVVEVSTAPGCRNPAESCEVDHLVDWANGGPTAEHNLGPACRHHNPAPPRDLNGSVTTPEPKRCHWSPTATHPSTYDPWTFAVCGSPEPRGAWACLVVLV